MCCAGFSTLSAARSDGQIGRFFDLCRNAIDVRIVSAVCAVSNPSPEFPPVMTYVFILCINASRFDHSFSASLKLCGTLLGPLTA